MYRSQVQDHSLRLAIWRTVYKILQWLTTVLCWILGRYAFTITNVHRNNIEVECEAFSGPLQSSLISMRSRTKLISMAACLARHDRITLWEVSCRHHFVRGITSMGTTSFWVTARMAKRMAKWMAKSASGLLKKKTFANAQCRQYDGDSRPTWFPGRYSTLWKVPCQFVLLSKMRRFSGLWPRGPWLLKDEFTPGQLLYGKARVFLRATIYFQWFMIWCSNFLDLLCQHFSRIVRIWVP